ncbi:MAG: lysophospholipid acyltransferase family protein, partial [Akkermansiaceae bacterium]|nr:lysophospholipid acyltransferase family protein [Verrucomicrobiales bacterium]
TFAGEVTVPPAPGAQTPPPGGNASEISAPSSLYRSGFWRAGLWIVRILPRGLCIALGTFLATLYCAWSSERRETVIQNLLPALNGDRPAATRKARSLFREFAVKVIDLWQYEAGLPVDRLLGEASGWEHFAAAQASGRGVLLLTPHLGNWEFGGPWMARKGITLQVITLAEPGKNFTELRQASRARWNIETLVIGNDPFAFLEIIKRLESGATVALLLDRPPGPTAVEVKLFGQAFPASISAAELARASGCVLLPVYIPRTNDSYAAHILPPVEYHRAALRDRANRQKLTQEIMRTFEPIIRRHLDQWYHFIPIWPR